MILRKLLVIIIFTVLSISCDTSNQQEINDKKAVLSEKADAINSDFKTIRLEVEKLATEITMLYNKQDSILPRVDKSKYMFSSNGVFFKPVDDGGSAIFVSGYYPIDENVKNAVYFTEPIDSSLRKLVRKYPEIVQAYYNDKSSINRIYPFFDVLSQYEAKMDIPAYNFFYLADKAHNPEKKSLWVNEPYVDPAGRGWMVSAIAPVYYKNKHEGVPGIDVTISRITKRYLSETPDDMILIIDNSGVIVTGQEGTINLLSFPPLFEHKYVETIKQDTYRKETYNLALSKDQQVRTAAAEILKNGKDYVKFRINGEDITMIAAYIPELDWHMLEILKK